MSGKFINSTSPPKSPFWMRQLEKGAGDVGLQLVKDGRASAVHLGLQVAPEAEVEEGDRGGYSPPLIRFLETTKFTVLVSE